MTFAITSHVCVQPRAGNGLIEGLARTLALAWVRLSRPQAGLACASCWRSWKPLPFLARPFLPWEVRWVRGSPPSRSLPFGPTDIQTWQDRRWFHRAQTRGTGPEPWSDRNTHTSPRCAQIASSALEKADGADAGELVTGRAGWGAAGLVALLNTKT